MEYTIALLQIIDKNVFAPKDVFQYYYCGQSRTAVAFAYLFSIHFDLIFDSCGWVDGFIQTTNKGDSFLNYIFRIKMYICTFLIYFKTEMAYM